MAAKFFGQFLLEKGRINRDQLLEALEAQRASNPMLGEIAVSTGILSEDDAHRINEHQRREDSRFGDIAQRLGLLTAAQVDGLLAQQKAQRRFFGEILLEQGVLTQAELDDELELHQRERQDAVKVLELGIAGHPLGDVATAAINTCTRLFPRIAKAPCQFSSLAANPDVLDDYSVTVSIGITGDRPFTLALACGTEVMRSVGAAFVGMTADDCDDELAQDALGEYLNVVMGYVVQDVLADDASYRATPPDFQRPATGSFAAQSSLVLQMTSELGPFAVVIAA